MCIRYAVILISCLILVSCKANVSEQYPQTDKSPPTDKELLDDASRFAKKILGESLRVHKTEYIRGELGINALFESEKLIDYTTFSNERYQKDSGPFVLKDCILFAANYKDSKSAESAFELLKESSKIRASEVEGMAGITPVQVRFLEKIRNDEAGGMFTQQGSYLFFLVEYGQVPSIATSWENYENLFLESIAGDDTSIETLKIRK